jgi:endonuclease-3
LAENYPDSISAYNMSNNNITANIVLEMLTPEYGPFEWVPRLDPVSEIVATILSQHTSDTNSERAFAQLIKSFGTLEQVAKADVRSIETCIRTGGLANVKAPRIKNALNIILQERGSLDVRFLKDLPLDQAKQWLKDIPGIGPKSAAVILCFALGMPAMAVDTHVYRVSKRLGLIEPNSGYQDAHDVLETAVHPGNVFGLHMALITHGRKVCKAIRPLCGECIVQNSCPSSHLGNTKSRRKN